MTYCAINNLDQKGRPMTWAHWVLLWAIGNLILLCFMAGRASHHDDDNLL